MGGAFLSLQQWNVSAVLVLLFFNNNLTCLEQQRLGCSGYAIHILLFNHADILNNLNVSSKALPFCWPESLGP